MSSKEIITENKPLVNYPMLDEVKVFFEGRCFFEGAVRMFREAGCIWAPTIEEADLVVFLGGADINPALYDDKVHSSTYFSEARDKECITYFNHALEMGKPMFGICRGMQFLHAMAGGKLYQDVTNHAGPDHDIIDIETGAVYRTTSLHHQMCIVGDHCIPVAKAREPLSNHYKTGSTNHYGAKNIMELEAAYYPGIRGFAVQGHPEISNNGEFVAWVLTKIQTLFEEVPDEDNKLGTRELIRNISS